MEEKIRPFQLTALSVSLNVIPRRLAECAERSKAANGGNGLDMVLYELVATQLLLLGAKVWLRSSSGIHLGLRRREQEIVDLMLQAEKQIAAIVPRLEQGAHGKQERREHASAKLRA